MNKVLDRRWLPLLGPLLLFALWQLLISAQFVKPVLLPPPGETLAHMAGVFANGAIFGDLWATIFRTLCSFGIATVIGVPLGVMLGSSEAAYRSVEFLIDFFRSTPSSALIPLFLLIFGITDINKIAIASFGAMLIVLFNSAYGVMNAKKTRVMAAQIMGVSKWHVFKDVMLMESLAQTFVGLRSAISMALVIVIVAEMFIGSENGLGHRIIDAQQVFNVKEMYCSILVTGALGYLLNLLFLLIEKKLVHWSGKARRRLLRVACWRGGRYPAGAYCGGRPSRATPLRCSQRGRAAKLATLTAFAAFGQSPRIRVNEAREYARRPLPLRFSPPHKSPPPGTAHRADRSWCLPTNTSVPLAYPPAALLT
jgi:NitT/TauT family transport system permease protein